VDFSPDGKTLAYGARSGQVFLLDAETGKPRRAARAHGKAVSFVSYSPDGKLLATAGFDQSIGIWQVQPWKSVARYRTPAEAGSAHCVKFSPKGRYLGIGYANGQVDVLPLAFQGRKPPKAHKFLGHKSGVCWVDFSPDGKLVVSASRDRTIRVRENLTLGRELLKLKGHELQVNAVSFTPDGKRLVSAGHDGTVRLWDARTNFSRLDIYNNLRLWYADFSSDGERIAAASSGRRSKTKPEPSFVGIWDAATGRKKTRLVVGDEWAFGVAYARRGRRLAASYVTGSLRVWDSASDSKLTSIAAHGEGPCVVALDPQGKLLASGGNGKLVKLWDAESGRSVAELAGHSSYVLAVAFSPDGKLLASGGVDSTLMLWNVEGGKLVRTIRSNSGPVNRVAFCPEGKLLAGGTKDGEIRVLSLIHISEPTRPY